MDSIGKGAMLLLLLAVPTALVVLAMLYGLDSLGWPQWPALAGLANLYPRPGTPLALIAVVSRPAAVVLLVCGLLR